MRKLFNRNAVVVSILSFLSLSSIVSEARGLPTQWCRRGNGKSCILGHRMKVLILPAGFTSYDQFKAAYDQFLNTVSNLPGSTFLSTQKNHIAYTGHWLSGGELGASNSNFNSRISTLPSGESYPTLDQNALQNVVNSIKLNLLGTQRPDAVVVIYNTNNSAVKPLSTVAAYTPQKKNYGISRLTLAQLDQPYIVAHEMAHSAMNFMDEYSESSLSSTSFIQSASALTNGLCAGYSPALQSSCLSLFTLNAAEVIANNGNDNVDTVASSRFTEEGAMFYGKGLFHAAGPSVMGVDNSFDYSQSASQQAVVSSLFNLFTTTYRTNGRLRNVGPSSNWNVALLGSTVTAVLFDADKENILQPTEEYSVKVGHYEVSYHTCWWGPFPYACQDNHWVEKDISVAPVTKTITFASRAIFNSQMSDFLCKLGIPTSNGLDVCAQLASNNANDSSWSVTLRSPYQDVTFQTIQPLTTYSWRFRAKNKKGWSAYTNWSNFFRTQ